MPNRPPYRVPCNRRGRPPRCGSSCAAGFVSSDLRIPGAARFSVFRGRGSSLRLLAEPVYIAAGLGERQHLAAHGGRGRTKAEVNPAMLMDQLVKGDGRLVDLPRRLKRCERRYNEIRSEAELVG